MFVERDQQGRVKGVYARSQPGYAEEELPDDHADVVAYLNPPQPVPEAISDRQFFHALALAGEITQAEALAAVRTGDIPAAMQAVIDTLPAEQQFDAEMLLSGATEFRRSHPMVGLIGAALERTSEEIDDLWRTAAAL